MNLPPMEWYVHFRHGGIDQINWHPNPEEAIEVACLLIDLGADVSGIGTGPLKDAVDRDRVKRLYDLWVRPKHPFGFS
jgi:hypothetical protein